MLSLILTKLDFAEDEELSRFARLYGAASSGSSRPGSNSSTGPCVRARRAWSSRTRSM